MCCNWCRQGSGCSLVSQACEMEQIIASWVPSAQFWTSSCVTNALWCLPSHLNISSSASCRLGRGRLERTKSARYLSADFCKGASCLMSNMNSNIFCQSFWHLGRLKLAFVARILNCSPIFEWHLNIFEWLAIFSWHVTGSVIFGLSFTCKETRKAEQYPLRAYNHWSCFGCNLRIQWSVQHCRAWLYCGAAATGGQTWLGPTEHRNLVGIGRKPVDLASRIEPWGNFSSTSGANPKRRKEKETLYTHVRQALNY